MMREREEMLAAAGVHIFQTGVVETAADRLVGLSDLAIYASTPRHAWQWMTLVDPAPSRPRVCRRSSPPHAYRPS